VPEFLTGDGVVRHRVACLDTVVAEDTAADLPERHLVIHVLIVPVAALLRREELLRRPVRVLSAAPAANVSVDGREGEAQHQNAEDRKDTAAEHDFLLCGVEIMTEW
jgi:hypothetical protein